MVVSADQRRALVWHIYTLIRANPWRKRLRLQGLDPARPYRISNTNETFGGDFLQEAGLGIPLPKTDFESILWEVKAR